MLGEESESKEGRLEEVRTETWSMLSVSPLSRDVETPALKSPLPAHTWLTSLTGHASELGYNHNAPQNCVQAAFAIRAERAPKRPSQHCLRGHRLTSLSAVFPLSVVNHADLPFRFICSVDHGAVTTLCPMGPRYPILKEPSLGTLLIKR